MWLTTSKSSSPLSLLFQFSELKKQRGLVYCNFCAFFVSPHCLKALRGTITSHSTSLKIIKIVNRSLSLTTKFFRYFKICRLLVVTGIFCKTLISKGLKTAHFPKSEKSGWEDTIFIYDKFQGCLQVKNSGIFLNFLKFQSNLNKFILFLMTVS